MCIQNIYALRLLEIAACAWIQKCVYVFYIRILFIRALPFDPTKKSENKYTYICARTDTGMCVYIFCSMEPFHLK